MASVSGLLTGFVQAVGVIFRSLWHSLGARGGLVTGLLLTVVFIILFTLGTETGRLVVTRAVLDASDRFLPGLTIEAEDIGSPSLGRWTFTELRTSYEGKALLDARDLILDVDLIGLRKHIDLRELRAVSVWLDYDVLQRLLQDHFPASAEDDTTPQDPPDPIASDTDSAADTASNLPPDAVEPEEAEAELQQDFNLPSIRVQSVALEKVAVVMKSVPDLPEVALRGEGSLRWQGQPAHLSLQLDEHGGAGLEIQASGEQVANGEDYQVAFTAREKAGGFLGDLLHLPEGESLDASGNLLVTPEDDQHIRIQVNQLQVPLVSHQFAASGDLLLMLAPWQVVTDGLILKVDESSHRVAGFVNGNTIDLEVLLRKFPLSVSEPWQELLKGGWVSAEVSVRGPLRLPSVNGTLDLRTSLNGERVALEAAVSTTGKVLSIERAKLGIQDARLAISGDVDLGGEQLDLNGSLDKVTVAQVKNLLAVLPWTEDVTLPPDLGGAVKALAFAARGPWQNPDFSLELDASPTYRGFPTRLQARATGDLKQLQIQDLALTGEGLRVSGNGSIQLADRTLELQLDVATEDFDPQALLDLPVTEPLSLDLEMAVAVKGPWDGLAVDAKLESSGQYGGYRYQLYGAAVGDLEELVLDRMRLQLSNGSGAGQQLRQSLLLNAGEQSGLRQSPARVQQLAAETEQLGRRGEAWLEVDGRLRLKAKTLEGTVAARNVPLSLLELVGAELPPSLDGIASLEGQFEGPLSAPEADANLLAYGNFRGEPWSLEGDISYGAGRIRLDGVQLLWADRNRFVAEGSVDQTRLDLKVEGSAALADLQLPLPAEVNDAGVVTLSAVAEGSPKQPQLSGRLQLESRTINRGNQVLPLTASLSWQTRAGKLAVDFGIVHGGRQAAEANGELAIAPIFSRLFAERAPGEPLPPLPLKYQSQGRADLSALGVFFDPEIHRLRGQVRYAINADGTVADPRISGNIDLSGGDYEHRPSNTRLRQIEFAMTMTPTQWQIVRASAEDGERGRVRIEGGVRFSPNIPPVMDLALTARRMRLLNTPAVNGAVSGSLTLTGNTEDALLAGDLNLRPLEVQIEQLFGSSVPEIQVVEVEVDGEVDPPGPPLLEKIALEIAVILDKQSYVRGLGLNSQLQGTVNVRGTAAKPEAGGELTIVRGNFDLLGKRFELLEGRVQFENNEAAIYAKGEHTYTDGEITAEISGTTKDLDVKFSSTPDAAQDEIFAQLLFGKSRSDISPLQAVRLVTVLRSLRSGGSVFDPVERTRALLGVDTLDVKSEEGDSGDEYALSLGKYITNRVYLEVQRSTDPLNPWQAQMQVELRRNLNLQIKSADESESGAGSVELQWKKDY